MKKIAITMGDPGGIGPEIIIRALLHSDISEYCTPVVIGDRHVLEDAIQLLKQYAKLKLITTPEQSAPAPGAIELIEEGKLESFEKSRPSAQGGAAAVSYIKKAVDLALAGKVDAVVTAPISKEALRMGGYPWPGHTEMLAELTGTGTYAMMLVGGLLRVVLVTIHTSLRSVPELVTKENVLRTIRLGMTACRMLGIQEPRIAVSGLNPHAGEGGIFGTEEMEAIAPAVDEARKEGIPAEGPIPPDTVFFKAYHGQVDLVICMYHDQGLIPLKMIAFEEGVNVTVGLPIIRTSPDHGTAYDIAWKGKASPSSLLEAIKLASRLKV